MPITTTINPPLVSDTPAEFDSKAFAAWQALNTWATEANATAATANASVASSAASAATATTKAGEASSSETSATNSASAASVSASSASTSASTATTQAGIATTKAGEAAASAADAAATVTSKVSKSGDTMTGALRIENYPPTGDNPYSLFSYNNFLYSGGGPFGTSTYTFDFGNKPSASIPYGQVDFYPNIKARNGVVLNGGITADTSAINIGSGQIVKDTSGNFSVGGVAYANGAVTLTQGGVVYAVTDSGVANVSVIGAIGGVSNGFAVTQNTSNQLSYTWGNGAGGVNVMTLDSSGNVGIGAPSPEGKVHVSANGNNLILSNGNPGTDGAPTYQEIKFKGYGSTEKARITGADRSSNSVYGRLSFWTGSAGVMSEHLCIDSEIGAVTSHVGPFGYGAGAGGTVTQITSKTNGVTLNKPSGTITMHNAALADGATVTFPLSNTFVTAIGTTVVTSIDVSSIAAYGYSITVHTAAGIAYISLTNNTGASGSDAVVINFAVIKGSTT